MFIVDGYTLHILATARAPGAAVEGADTAMVPHPNISGLGQGSVSHTCGICLKSLRSVRWSRTCCVTGSLFGAAPEVGRGMGTMGVLDATCSVSFSRLAPCPVFSVAQAPHQQV